MTTDETPDDLPPRLRAAQVQLLFDRTRASIWTNLAAALLVTGLLWGRVPQVLLLGWLALKTLAIAVRLDVEPVLR